MLLGYSCVIIQVQGSPKVSDYQMIKKWY